MAQRFVFLIAMVAALLGGCDRLSEKDKMEMITMCDTMARRQIAETKEIGELFAKSVKVNTHYSFTDSKCYALETSTLLIFRKNKSPVVITSESLYDGLSKEKLLSLGSAAGSEFDGMSGDVIGSLASEKMPREEASKIIKAKMSKP